MTHKLIAAAMVSLCVAAPPASAAAGQAAAPSSGQLRYRSIFPASAPAGVLDPLKAEEGIWDAEVELYVGDPARQPLRRRGVQINRLVSQGNAILNDFRYDDGSYAGTGLWGWDALAGRYSGTWIDSETHLVRHDIGWWEPETRTLRWEADTLQRDGATTRMRIVQQFKGDTRRFQIDVMEAATGVYRKLIVMTFHRRRTAEEAP